MNGFDHKNKAVKKWTSIIILKPFEKFQNKNKLGKTLSGKDGGN